MPLVNHVDIALAVNRKEYNVIGIKFAKIRPNAIIPSKRDEDMGFDIYACFDEDYMIIKPHETKLIPTGIASACNPEWGFVLRERGSTGSKGIALRAGVIDSGYRNEWFVGLTNTTNKWLVISKVSIEEIVNNETQKTDNPQRKFDINMRMRDAIIYPYSKAIAQALVIPVPKAFVEEITYEELKTIESERGLGALGSSNK